MNIVGMKQYIKHKDGTYVALLMDDETKDLLDNFVEMNLGLSERVDPDTYHTTVIYSRTPVPTAENLRSGPATGTAVGYEVFPTKTGDKCLVMRVDCAAATMLNKQLTKMGATSDYDEYKPHVTLCYNYNGPDDVSELPIPQFSLGFKGFEVKPLEPDYVPPNKE
jgi:2'-5' RNA ligase